MKTFVTALTLLSLSISCFADITIDDLPHLEGTPLVERVDDIPVWNVLDYAEKDGEVQWAWLENAGQLAYLAYAGNSDVVTFPDGFKLTTKADHVSISIEASDGQYWSFLRFGGELIFQGANLYVSYLPDIVQDTSQENSSRSERGNTYQLENNYTLHVSGRATADFIASGQVFSIAGTNFKDTLQAPNTDNRWVMSDLSNQLEIGGEDPATVHYSSIEILIGGSERDIFQIPSLGFLSIDGGGGDDDIILGSPQNDGTSNNDGSLSGNSGSGITIGIGSEVAVINPRDPYFLVSHPIDFYLSLPDTYIINETICKLPEPHEYTGEKKILCGDQWMEVSDEAWADLTMNSDLQPAEEPQEQNPFNKKKSKGGSISFSTLQLLLLLLIFQRWAGMNRRSKN